MSLDMADAESSYAYGLAEFNQFVREFNAQWYMPMALTQLGMLLGSVAPHEVDQINPEALARVQGLMAKMTGEEPNA